MLSATWHLSVEQHITDLSWEGGSTTTASVVLSCPMKTYSDKCQVCSGPHYKDQQSTESSFFLVMLTYQTPSSRASERFVTHKNMRPLKRKWIKPRLSYTVILCPTQMHLLMLVCFYNQERILISVAEIKLANVVTPRTPSCNKEQKQRSFCFWIIQRSQSSQSVALPRPIIYVY